MIDKHIKSVSGELFELSDQNPNPVLRIDASGKILYVNEAGYQLKPVLIDKKSQSLPVKWASLFLELLRKGEKKSLEVDTGSSIFILNIVPFSIEGYLNIYGHDVTELHRHKESLKQSEETSRNLFNSVNEGIIIHNHDIILDCNQRVSEMLDYPLHKIIGSKLSGIFHESCREAAITSLKNNPENPIETIVSKINDTQIPVEATSRIYVHQGKLASVTTIKDISEKKKSEKEALRQRKLFNDILNNLPINIFLKDKAGRYIFLNKEAIESSGLNPDSIIGKTAKEFMPADKAMLTETSDRLVWEKQSFYSAEEKVIVNNQEMHLLVGKTIIDIENYEEPLLLGYSFNISDRKKAEEDILKAKQLMEESFRARENFISIMSHEIRTPMNAVIGMTNLLMQSPHFPEQRDYLNALKTSSDNLLAIINNILDLSKMESGKILFEEVGFNLEELVNKLRQTFAFKAAEKNILLEVNLDPDISPTLVGDPHRLNQIFMNLISNSLKFTEEGFIRLNAEIMEKSAEDIHILFSVQDTGIGIPEEKLHSIFESFTQAHTETTRKYGGTGLGLTITKKLIELQGGSIGVESRLKEGSKFIFDLKYKIAENIPGVLKQEPKKIFNLKGSRILIVEDNQMNQLVVRKFLERHQVFTDVAEDGLEALEKIKNNVYDLILMDIQMPKMDGFQATDYIRNKMPSPYNRIPVIALTASSLSGLQHKIEKHKINDYILKPFKPEILFQKIAEHLHIENTAEKEIPETVSKPSDMRNTYTNLNYLKNASGDNKEFLREMISIFIQQTPVFIAGLKEFTAEKNWMEFRKIMHKMKPTITMMGIDKLENIVSEIDRCVKQQTDLHLVPELVNELDRICKFSFAELEEELSLMK